MRNILYTNVIHWQHDDFTIVKIHDANLLSHHLNSQRDIQFLAEIYEGCLYCEQWYKLQCSPGYVAKVLVIASPLDQIDLKPGLTSFQDIARDTAGLYKFSTPLFRFLYERVLWGVAYFIATICIQGWEALGFSSLSAISTFYPPIEWDKEMQVCLFYMIIFLQYMQEKNNAIIDQSTRW